MYVDSEGQSWIKIYLRQKHEDATAIYYSAIRMFSFALQILILKLVLN